jgi:carbamoyltransferase
MSRTVLGLNAYSHDAGVALFVDRTLVFASEQERYDRVKHSPAFPAEAIGAALQHAGLGPRDIDAVAFPWRRGMARLKKTLYVLRRLPRSLPFLTQRPAGLPPRLGYLASVARLGADLRAAGITAPITYVDHHFAHAVQAHRFGPADEASLLTADGMGEWTATATWLARGPEPEAIARQCYPHSLGKVYAAVTQHLGFRPDSGEGKTMGLAPYGETGLVSRFRELMRPDEERLYRVDLKGFSYPLGHTHMGGDSFAEQFGPPRAPGEPLEQHHMDLARAAQEVLEEVILDMIRRLPRRRHLGLAGGIFLNCVLNGRILREAGFDSLYVFPAAGDSGAAAGAGAWVAGMDRRELKDPFLGDAFDEAAIDRAIGGRSHRVVPDPATVAAEALSNGGFVGWFQGRMEFGPRALGARSILADPREADVKERLNRTVKFREAFRPYAPVVLAEEAGAWFHDAHPSPFMLLTFLATPKAREQVPGVVHVDGSARVQTVEREGPLREVLEAFAARTGAGVLLNTSFNVRGEPIVRTPEEAIAVFEKTALDLLVLGDRVLEKSVSCPRT